MGIFGGFFKKVGGKSKVYNLSSDNVFSTPLKQCIIPTDSTTEETIHGIKTDTITLVTDKIIK